MQKNGTKTAAQYHAKQTPLSCTLLKLAGTFEKVLYDNSQSGHYYISCTRFNTIAQHRLEETLNWRSKTPRHHLRSCHL